jgi:Protein of unknown function (DUF3293)
MKTEKLTIPTELLQAYAETRYTVHTDEKFTLKIGELSPSLLHLFHQTNALCAAFVTAYNPFSEQLTVTQNEALQTALKADLTKRSLKFIDGIGQHLNGQWPGEPSVLILARHYEQNAFVWCGRDGVPQLVAA